MEKTKKKHQAPVIHFKPRKPQNEPEPFEVINKFSYESVSSVVGSDLVFAGDITSGDSLRFEGTLKGNINITGNLIIGRNALVTGDIRAGSVHVIGIVDGNIHCEQLKILSTGKITGDAYVSSIVIDEGAIFIGKCKTKSDSDEAPNIEDILNVIS